MKTGKPPLNTIKLLENISLGSAVFAVVLCVLIIVNFIQVRRADPLNSPAMTVLVEKLQNDPSNDQLRQEIRTLDLIARKAFFTAQWQVRTGGYLLFISILVLVSCIKAIELIRSKLPEEPAAKPLMFWETRILKRHWLVYSGIALVVLTLLLAWLTHNDLGKDLRNAASKEQGSGNREPGAVNPDSATVVSDTTFTSHQSPVTIRQLPSLPGKKSKTISLRSGDQEESGLQSVQAFLPAGTEKAGRTSGGKPPYRCRDIIHR